MKTKQLSSSDFDKRWYIVDLKDIVLGRAATRIANVLRGKNHVGFTPHTHGGDFVVAINADKVKLTGSNKLAQKKYYYHTGFPGGIREISAAKLSDKNPEEIIKKAVRGMLPKNILGRDALRKLKVYAGEKHPHEAQQPQELKL